MTLPASALPVETPPAFLGVAQSATGKLWRDRLDARGAARALAIAQRHQLPELLARVLAGRGVEIDAVEDFLDPTIRKLMPDPYTVTQMEAAAKRIADAAMRGEKVAIFGDYDVDGATSAALLAWHSAPLRARSADPHSRPHFRRLRPQYRSGARARGEGRDAAGHRRLRHHQPRAAGGSAAARHVGGRDRSSPGRRGAARGRCAGQSEPARRSLRPRPSRRRRARAGDAGRGQPRAARPRLLDRRDARAGSARHAASRRARHRRRCRAADRAQPRLRRQGTDRDAPARPCRPYRADGRGAAERPAGSLASRLHAGAAHQCRRPHRPRRSRRAAAAGGRRLGSGADRRRARPPQQRAPRHRAGGGGAGRSRGAGRARARGQGRGDRHGVRRLASRRGRPRRARG